MKWLRVEEVKAAAKKSKRAATASCKKHWKQNYTATEGEVDGRMPWDVYGRELCALCVRFEEDCSTCPLGMANEQNVCGKEYSAATKAFGRWRNGGGRFSTWQKKAKLMYERLCEL